MFTIGIDIQILAIIGIACVLATVIVCAIIPVSREEGESAVIASGLTMIVMLVGYVIMACVLDHTVGIYW
jgi:hypothetical protein